MVVNAPGRGLRASAGWPGLWLRRAERRVQKHFKRSYFHFGDAKDVQIRALVAAVILEIADCATEDDPGQENTGRAQDPRSLAGWD